MARAGIFHQLLPNNSSKMHGEHPAPLGASVLDTCMVAGCLRGVFGFVFSLWCKTKKQDVS